MSLIGCYFAPHSERHLVADDPPTTTSQRSASATSDSGVSSSCDVTAAAAVAAVAAVAVSETPEERRRRHFASLGDDELPSLDPSLYSDMFPRQQQPSSSSSPSPPPSSQDTEFRSPPPPAKVSHTSRRLTTQPGCSCRDDDVILSRFWPPLGVKQSIIPNMQSIALVYSMCTVISICLRAQYILVIFSVCVIVQICYHICVSIFSVSVQRKQRRRSKSQVLLVSSLGCLHTHIFQLVLMRVWRVCDTRSVCVTSRSFDVLQSPRSTIVRRTTGSRRR